MKDTIQFTEHHSYFKNFAELAAWEMIDQPEIYAEAKSLLRPAKSEAKSTRQKAMSRLRALAKMGNNILESAKWKVAPWVDKPNGLVNWWDMENFAAVRFLQASRAIGAMLQYYCGGKNPEDIAPLPWIFTHNLEVAQKMCQELGLRQAEKAFGRVLAAAEVRKSGVQKDEILRLIGEANRLFQSEMEDHLFFSVPAKNIELYTQKEPLFGQSVFDAFPSLIDEIAEAGKCLALDRNTACVFHLMRVMEGGLKLLSKKLEIPYAPSWESHIKQITAKVAAQHKTKGIKWKKDEAFFKDVLGDLTSVKMAWRNPTMHIVKSYDSKQAENVLNAVGSFMRHLATRLKEVRRV